MRKYATLAAVLVACLGLTVSADTVATESGGTMIVDPLTGGTIDWGASGDFLMNNGSLPTGSGRTVSRGNVAGGWTVFQPFTVTDPGWEITSIGVDGWGVLDPAGTGMLGSLLSDSDGTPNEEDVLSSAVYFLGDDPFSANWQDEAQSATLAPGSYWLKWEDNNSADYWGAIFNAPSGENSFSRNDAGQEFGSGPTALRISGTVVPEPTSLALLAIGGLALIRRR